LFKLINPRLFTYTTFLTPHYNNGSLIFDRIIIKKKKSGVCKRSFGHEDLSFVTNDKCSRNLLAKKHLKFLKRRKISQTRQKQPRRSSDNAR